MSRGFTLLELMIAAALSALMATAAFAAVQQIQSATGEQGRAASSSAAARNALETIGRDIRAAGDSHQFLGGHCLAGTQHAAATGTCPAVLEPHPWRVTLTRNSWIGGAWGQAVVGEENEQPRITAGVTAFGAGIGSENNVVAYEFVPQLADAQAYLDFTMGQAQGGAITGQARTVWVGRIDRIVNPFNFNGARARREVLLSNVMLDDAMVVDPGAADGDAFEPTYNFSLFTYQVLGVVNPGLVELEGAPARAGDPANAPVIGAVLSPPLRFFAIGPPTAFDLIAAPPYAGTYNAQVVGLQDGAGTVGADLLATTPPIGTFVDLRDNTSDLRFLLDRNRLRAVRVGFKVFEEWDPTNNRPVEDRNFFLGLDVDNDPTTGTARVYSFSTTFELKTYAQNISAL